MTEYEQAKYQLQNLCPVALEESEVSTDSLLSSLTSLQMCASNHTYDEIDCITCFHQQLNKEVNE